MKFPAMPLCLAVLMAAPLLTPVSASAQDLTSEKGKLSYALGFQIGRDMVERQLDVDAATIVRGLQDGFANRNPGVPEEDMREVLVRMEERLREQAVQRFREISEENRRRSEAFLAENRTKRGVVSLPSGIQYRVIEDGDGRRPNAQSEVTLHYRGSLSSGLEFESSFARGTPVTFKLDQVMAGWQEVLPLMKIGDYWQVFMPPDLAFGERGNPPAIGPNEVLVYDVRLIDVK